MAGASGNLTTLCYNDNTEGSIAERVKALCHGRASLQLHAGASKCCFAQHQGEPSEFRKELQRWLGHPCYPNGPSTPFIILFLVLGIKSKTLPMLGSASSGTTFPSQTLGHTSRAGPPAGPSLLSPWPSSFLRGSLSQIVLINALSSQIVCSDRMPLKLQQPLFLCGSQTSAPVTSVQAPAPSGDL